MSTIRVDRITPYQSGSVAIEGLNITNLTIDGTLTASLQQGYVWVGNSAGRTTTVPTSSFGGGGGSDITALNSFTASQQVLNTTFATTGSNTFYGTNLFSGSLTSTGSVQFRSPSYRNGIGVDQSGSVFTQNDTRISMVLKPSGSSNTGVVQVYDNEDGNSILSTYATIMSIGTTQATSIQIGNNDSFNYYRGNNYYYGNITGSNITANSFSGSFTGSVNILNTESIIFEGGNIVLSSDGLTPNLSGSSNIVIGYEAGLNNRASYNTFIGGGSGRANAVGNQNVYVGINAGYNNISGSNNAFFGPQVSVYGVTGSENSIFGYAAGNYNNGNYNVFMGSKTANNVSTGSENVVVGGYAATGSTSSEYLRFLSASVIVGYGASPNNDNPINQVIIGHDAIGNGNNTVTLGNDGITNTYLKGVVSGSSFTGSFVGDGSGLTNLNLPSGLLSSSETNFTDFSQSVDTRIDNIVAGTGFATTGSNVFVGNQIITGSLLFSGSIDEQTLAYAGGAGHMMMIDTNRTDVYTEVGTADKPFKTLSAAITASNAANPSGTDPYTFVMMGCNIDENISFDGTTFNFITLATTCRTVFNGTLTITDNPNLKQLVIRNLEFAEPVTITGDGTTAQMSDMSFYNTSFADTLNVTCANSLALWDVYSSAAVNLTNLNYLYVGGGQITGDITIVADSTQTLPSEGMGPGQSIVFDLICNNLIFTRGGSASYVFQPHNTRIGLNAGSYTIPVGFTLSAQASTLRGTWTNNGSLTLRNSSTDNAVIGTPPTYTGRIGGTILATSVVVSGSLGVSGSISQKGVGGAGNIVIGENPLTNLTSEAIYNVIIGQDAGVLNSSGSSNVYIGRNAGILNQIGNSNVMIGTYAGYNAKNSQNVYIGESAGAQNISGQYNVAIGHQAGYNNKVNLNTFIGWQSGFANSSGSGNTFVGERSGESNTIGNNNSFFGGSSGRDTIVGSNNTFIGQNAGQQNTSGSSNTFVGSQAGSYTTTGGNNTFVGEQAGILNTIGYSNAFFGDNSGYRNTTAYENTFIGSFSGYENKTGVENTFVGTSAGQNNGVGSDNTYIGHRAGNSNISGSNNTLVGNSAGFNITSGSDNTFFGKNAGYYISNGSSAVSGSNRSVFIGTDVKSNGHDETNQIVIGYDAVGNGTNTVTIGNNDITDTYLKGTLRASTAILAQVSSSYNFADDAAAASGGVPLGGLYHTSGTIKIRLA